MPIDAIQMALSLANNFYELIQTAHANQEQCQQLCNRIRPLTDQLRVLKEMPTQSTFNRGLHEFEDCLQQTIAFVGKFAKRSKLKRMLNIRDDERKFRNLNRALDQAISHLQLGLQVQNQVDRERIAEAARADRQALLAQQQEIEAYCKGVWAEQKIQGAQAQDQQAALQAQLASLQQQFLELANPLSPSSHPQSTSSTIQQIAFFSLQLTTFLGQGSCGRVYLGTWCHQPVAIKRLEGEVTPEEDKRFQREIQILHHLSHPHITTLYGVCDEPGRRCLIIDALTGGTLRERLDKGDFTPLQRLQIALTMAKTFIYLTSQRVVHRRLRSRNILFDAHDKVYLTDLGWSKPHSLMLSTIAHGKAGYAWEAPECINGSAATAASDVYSFGIVLWELVTGKVPFAGCKDSDIIRRVSAGERPPLPADHSPITPLIQACWSQQVWQRPDWEQIVEDLKICCELEEKQQQSAEALEQQFSLGRAAEKNKDYYTAQQHYETAATAGHVRASAYLGSLLLKGKTGTANKASAHQWLLQAAHQGNDAAMLNLAQQLFYGDGVDENKTAAAEWLTRIPEDSQYYDNAKKLLAKCPCTEDTKTALWM